MKKVKLIVSSVALLASACHHDGESPVVCMNLPSSTPDQTISGIAYGLKPAADFSIEGSLPSGRSGTARPNIGLYAADGLKIYLRGAYVRDDAAAFPASIAFYGVDQENPKLLSLAFCALHLLKEHDVEEVWACENSESASRTEEIFREWGSLDADQKSADNWCKESA
ncbi:hypothetical protein HFP89_14200 [Wenzhouxiangella sp. XN79A]|uniref:hypothetical protein n=1 Tax=Wenzhouxiangella sp. XN79A TaxID=2724193 RepID=UPI00144ACD90|nr:hypothetical protein [Wenzhouxiangella sp. XN79A]NKI36318.1 hypothetical protein [Wenzhouxiangella sp. XN79A]